MNHKFASGVVCLLLFILLGIVAVEMQLNTLTLESDFAKVLNLRRNQESKTVSAYIFGEQVSLGEWKYPSAEMIAGDFVLALSADKQVRVHARSLDDLLEHEGKGVIERLRGYYQNARPAVADLREALGNYYATLVKHVRYYF